MTKIYPAVSYVNSMTISVGFLKKCLIETFIFAGESSRRYARSVTWCRGRSTPRSSSASAGAPPTPRARSSTRWPSWPSVRTARASSVYMRQVNQYSCALPSYPCKCRSYRIFRPKSSDPFLDLQIYTNKFHLSTVNLSH